MHLSKLFPTQRQPDPANSSNEAGGLAYRRKPEEALALYVATGCLSASHYTSAETQLSELLELLEGCSEEYVAKAAIWGRQRGLMKDMPALLTAWLAAQRSVHFASVFERTIDNTRMLRGFVQILRSGVLGRRSFGSLPKRLIQRWLDRRSDTQLFRASVGAKPSLGDIIRMLHPRPQTPSRSALYAYLTGRRYDFASLPQIVQDYEVFKETLAAQQKAAGWQGDRAYEDSFIPEAPDVPFEMLTSLPLHKQHWKDIARNAPWQRTRMNLNTFVRHGVLEDTELAHMVAARLRDGTQIRNARAFPYQLLAAYRHASSNVPRIVRDALALAAQTAISNVPKFADNTWICLDVSGSMHWPITGYRPGASSEMRCIDVAALMASAVLARNPYARVLPFHDRVEHASIRRTDSVLETAERLAALPSGGTNCSAPLNWIVKSKAKVDLVILVSDQESWSDYRFASQVNFAQTPMMQAWRKIEGRNPGARLACIDIAPYSTKQVINQSNVLCVGGFSDNVFTLLAQFARGGLDGSAFEQAIHGVAL
jgi:60 kDa SS-A/Ro ribonucleoprotein